MKATSIPLTLNPQLSTSSAPVVQRPGLRIRNAATWVRVLPGALDKTQDSVLRPFFDNSVQPKVSGERQQVSAKDGTSVSSHSPLTSRHSPLLSAHDVAAACRLAMADVRVQLPLGASWQMAFGG